MADGVAAGYITADKCFRPYRRALSRGRTGTMTVDRHRNLAVVPVDADGASASTTSRPSILSSTCKFVQHERSNGVLPIGPNRVLDTAEPQAGYCSASCCVARRRRSVPSVFASIDRMER